MNHFLRWAVAGFVASSVRFEDACRRLAACRRVAALIAAFVTLGAAATAFGQTTVTWTNSANSVWGTASNWSANVAPTSANNVLIDKDGVTVTVSTNSTGSASNVTVGATTSGSTTVLSVSGTASFGGNLTLGGVGTGNLTMSTGAGRFLSVGGNIIMSPGAGDSTITLNGTTPTLMTINGGLGSITDGGGAGASTIQSAGSWSGSLGLTTATVDNLYLANGSTNAFTITSGQTYNINFLRMNQSPSTAGSATLNINGGTLNQNTTSGLLFNSGSNAGNSSFINLNSGTITAVRIRRGQIGADAALNWNDGTIGNYTGSDLNILASNGTMNLVVAGTGVHTFNAESGRTITVESTALIQDKSGQNGTVTKAGGGTLILGGSNSYTGGTTLSAGTIQLGAAGALGPSGNITFSGGALQYTSGGAGTDYSSRIVNSGSAITLDSNSQSITLGSAVAASNTGGLRKLGAGTVTLSASNAFTGLTQVGAGSLTLGDVNALSASTLDLATADSGTVAFGVAGTNTYNLGGLQGSRSLANAGNRLAVGSNGGSTTFSGVLSGAGGLTKQGAGSLTLSASNTYTGPTDVTAGTLALSGAGSLVTTGTVGLNASGAAFDISGASGNRTIGALTAAAGSTVTLGANTLTFGDATSGTLAAAIGGTGGITKQGTGTVVLAGNNSYTGLTTVSAGILRLGANQSVSRAGDLVAVTSGTFDLDGYSLSGTTSTSQTGLSLGGGAAGTRAVIATGTGTLSIANSGAIFPWIKYDATNNPLGAEISGRLAISNTAGFTGFMAGDSTAAADDLTISAVISGSLNTLYSTQLGTVVFSGVNTFASTGNQIRAGTWVLATDSLRNQPGALGNNASGISVGHNVQTADATLILRGNVTTDRAVTIVTNTSAPLTHLRTVGGDATSGTATFSGGVTINTNTRLTAANGGTVVFSGGLSDGASSFQSAATISKIGLGTVILSGSNATTLPWAVQAGRLLVNGTNAGAGGTTVDTGALLGGSGRINGLVTVSGTLSPGNSPGILTLSQLVLTSTATTLMEIDGLTRGTQYDGIDLTTSGGLTYAGALSIAFGLGSPVADNTTFDLFNFSGTPTGDFTSVVSTGGVYAGTWSQVSSGTWSLQSGVQTLTFSTATGDVIIVPEPGTLAMLAGAAAAAFALARRRR